MSERYSIRISFRLSPGRFFDLSKGDTFEFGNKSGKISADAGWCAVTVGGFDKEYCAKKAIIEISAGLIWFALQRNVGIDVQSQQASVHYFRQPIDPSGSPLEKLAENKGWSHIDGTFDWNQTLLMPEHKRLLMVTAGSVTATLRYPASHLSKAMEEISNFPRASALVEYGRIALATEVYQASFFETSARATFLSMITSLEVLKREIPSSNCVRRLVDDTILKAKEIRNRADNPAIQREIGSLVTSLSRLKNFSITRSIKCLVRETLAGDSELGDPSEVADEIGKLYGLRSDIVHGEYIEKEKIRKANARLRQVIPVLLRKLIGEQS